jgi:hypothetical protein
VVRRIGSQPVRGGKGNEEHGGDSHGGGFLVEFPTRKPDQELRSLAWGRSKSDPVRER